MDADLTIGPHRAFLVLEVLSPAFRCFDLEMWQHAAFIVDPAQTESARLRSLAASARVRTLFRDVALLVLWETLCDLAPLLRLISCTMGGFIPPPYSASHWLSRPGIRIRRTDVVSF
ncbi:hypothetical protein PYCCODRAFT_1037458 [Trametes coccinea BRFM310]|uniref:Uncharacterized protein n=1 Tax=Trametes coccinea (strain BRFM310) TaxID=1353009 RepID=A0A1Y2IA41_TRAC3|nr:hypothetical protein PYCCODRAFT_1037458 [Trametes coccinea BRFM310]